MKKVLIISMTVALAFCVQADIAVNYIGGYGAAGPDGVSPLLGGGEQALIQLIYAGENGVVDGAATVGGGIENQIDDIILLSVLGPVASAGDFVTEFGVFTAAEIGGQVNGAGIPGGFVYGRIFQNSAAIGGSFYYQGVLAEMPNVDLGSNPAPTPTKYELMPQSAGAVADQVVVPEPATIGLMGIAGLGMFLARRKARR